MVNNVVLENARTARFAFSIDRYFDQGRDDIGLHFAFDRPADEYNKAQVSTQVVGLFAPEAAVATRQILFPTYRAFDFADLDKYTAEFITHSMAPLEWHTRLDTRDPKYMSHVTVWAEQMPVITPPPPPPTTGELLATALLTTFLGGMLSGADSGPSRADQTTLHDNIKAFVSMSQDEVPPGVKYWDLDTQLSRLARYIRNDETTKAVYLIKNMADHTDPCISIWGKQAIKSCGIPA